MVALKLNNQMDLFFQPVKVSDMETHCYILFNVAIDISIVFTNYVA
jgi:hypothetical protein